MILEPKSFSAEQLRIGLTAEFEREVSEEDILAFANNSGDFNPLHVDSDYAKTTNYHGRVAHGAFQISLASALIGMHLPGKNVLLSSIRCRFPAPLRYPSRVKVSGEIIAWNFNNRSGSLKVLVMESASLTTTAEIFMGFTLHEKGRSLDAVQGAQVQPGSLGEMAKSGSKTVLITGASGGIGTAIVSDLARDYNVLALVNRQPLGEELEALPNVGQLQADISLPEIKDRIGAALGEGSIYGIVHAAWPGAPRGGLLKSPDDVIEKQLFFGTTLMIRLARILFEHVTPEGGRFVALGSTFGSVNPLITLGAYSLGKGSMENTIRLLAPELARKNITINAICPSFVPVGMNKQANERQMKMETALVPMGRLCSPEDIVGMVRYLLASEASFVSGQIVALTGARL